MDVVPTRDGHPCWVDLSTTDVDGAVAFYTALLGWDVRRDETDMGTYVIASVGDREVAGIMAQAPDMAGAPSAWTMFVYVDDIDAMAAAVPAAGGTVVQEPFPIPDGTRVCVVADPGGAMFALISSRMQPGPYLTTTLGGVSWFELMSRDPAAAEDFYRTVFGWKATTEDTGRTLYTSFVCDDEPVAGMLPTPDGIPEGTPDTWSVYFTTDDCTATGRLAVEHGGEVLVPETPTPAGPFAVIADPQGAVFQVMAYDEAHGA